MMEVFACHKYTGKGHDGKGVMMEVFASHKYTGKGSCGGVCMPQIHRKGS